MKYRIMKKGEWYKVERFARHTVWSYQQSKDVAMDRWDCIAFFCFKFQAKSFLKKIKKGKLDKDGLEKEENNLILEVDIEGVE